MASKYDDFWRAHLDELAPLVECAADGRTCALDVVGLQRLGQRSSWYGSAVVRGREYQAAMAHMVALARLVADAGVCAEWPEVEFRFTVNQSGRLTVSTTAPRPGSPQARAARSVRPAASPMPSTGEDMSTLDPRVACADVHRLLEQLPLLATPDEVRFANGLYFFYETGEGSEHAPRGRIVRVGNHPRAADRLIARISEHYRNRQGAKNGSVFRRYIGGALIRQDNPASPCLLPSPGAGHWERQGLSECERCVAYEERVTTYLHRSLRFRCVRIDDMEERNRFEARLIATLAACPLCRPSSTWLGRHAYSLVVQASGLWNSDFIGGPQLNHRDLQRLEDLVAACGQTCEDGDDDVDLSDTLLIIPCCQSKRGLGVLDLSTRTVADFLSPGAVEILGTGRVAAFERPGTSIDPTSAKHSALRLYTGQPYETSRFREALVSLMRSGLHCLIVSGGYGLVRPEEPIRYYEAPIQRTTPVWRRRIPMLLADYVERQRIRRSFGAFSRQYASVIPARLTGNDWRAVPRFTRGDEGSAYHEVPRRVGSAVMRLVEARFDAERATDGSTPWEPST